MGGEQYMFSAVMHTDERNRPKRCGRMCSISSSCGLRFGCGEADPLVQEVQKQSNSCWIVLNMKTWQMHQRCAMPRSVRNPNCKGAGCNVKNNKQVESKGGCFAELVEYKFVRSQLRTADLEKENSEFCSKIHKL